jgi:S-formylglutathione hydrolase FrmB
MRLLFLVASALLTLNLNAVASKVDRLMVPSAAMKKDVAVNVVMPDGYDKDPDAHFPVLFLLHGAGDNDWTWLNASSVASLADQYGIILVCPSAELSWYFDSPEDPTSLYETFITAELLPYVDGHYRTRADRLHRALLGCSMGGHGALFLAIRHKDLFGIAVSLSGGVDFRPFPKNWNLDKILGAEADHPDRWNDLNVLNQAKSLKDGELAISIDCGVYDLFIAGNRALHQQLLDQKVMHDYSERPGYHGWTYWANCIPYQMLYVSRQFNQADAKK